MPVNLGSYSGFWKTEHPFVFFNCLLTSLIQTVFSCWEWCGSQVLSFPFFFLFVDCSVLFFLSLTISCILSSYLTSNLLLFSQELAILIFLTAIFRFYQILLLLQDSKTFYFFFSRVSCCLFLMVPFFLGSFS